MKHAINWFEIPVTDFDRAKAFYEAFFDEELSVMEAMGMKSGFFPVDFMNGAIGGCIIKGEGYIPSTEGAVIYLNGGDDLNEGLNRAINAGAEVILPKTSIGENGFMAFFKDSEGNKIGLHSNQ